MSKIEIITKPSKDLAYMDVCLQFGAVTKILESFLPHQADAMKTSKENFDPCAKDIEVEYCSGSLDVGVKTDNCTHITTWNDECIALSVRNTLLKKASLTPA